MSKIEEIEILEKGGVKNSKIEKKLEKRGPPERKREMGVQEKNFMEREN